MRQVRKVTKEYKADQPAIMDAVKTAWMLILD